MPSTTRRITTTAVGVALALTACSGDNGDTATTVPVPITTATTTTLDTTTTPQPTTTTSSTTTSTTQPDTTSTTTAATSTTTTSTTATVPTTQPGEPDWAAIVQGLLTTLHELRAAPDIDRIGELCLAGENACQRIQGGEIQRLIDEGWHVVGQPLPNVLGTQIIQTANDEPPTEALWVLLSIEAERQDLTNAQVVDQDGNTVFQLTNDGDSPTTTLNMMLTEGPDGWRVLSVEAESDE